MDNQNNKQNLDPEQENSINQPKKKRLNWQILLRTVGVFVCLVLAFGLLLSHWGLIINIQSANKGQISEKSMPAFNDLVPASTSTEMRKLQIIYNYLKENYYRELSDDEMIEAMYAGLLNEMDSPYTFYLDVEEYDMLQESMEGEYYGIGAQVGSRDGAYFILDIFDDSPALAAGLRNGDQILAVDGEPAENFADVSLLASKVRGEEGTKVTLTIYRSNDNEEMEVVVTRGKVTTANLKYSMLEDQIGYVRIVEFNQGVAKNFIHALDDLKEQGARTIIFDLRNNPGGYVSEVTAMLDYLLPEVDIAVAKGRSYGEEFSEAWTSDSFVGVPDDWEYTILVNENSASASELFTGCLRDVKGSTIVGKNTFGKGVGSITYELSDGSAIQITNFHYYLPKGDSINEIGIEPDMEVDLEKEYKGLTVSQLGENDTQLAAAIEHAKTLR
ncbi:MAG: S41 family peptidase [Eubacteriales bacterium]|nr:S41 family peptidase [Eubacteriales bacterium]